ncbi:MAG: thioredoxin reductase [Nitrospira bacterium SG8_35_1]|nr:MAG: thioredoxin reductase [Nitrospira bacterium SG8_35_1]
MSDELYDVIIIGGGPAGLSAAQYASRSNLKTVVLDKSPTAGALAYTSKIENYPGLVEPVSGSELLDLFRNQAIKFGAEYVEMQVVGVAIDQEIKEVQGIDKTYKGKTVIIATGSMGRKPSIPGEGEFLGKGVSYCAVCDAAFYKDLQVCVIGDSEEAVKEAGLLTGFAKTVYLIAPSKELDIQSYETELNRDKVKIITGHRVVSIDGDDFVKKIKIKNIETEEEQEIPMDGVFVYLYGTQPVVDFLSSSLSLSDKSCIITHRTMETSIPGVFAAGDVSCSEVRQVVIAAAFGSMAALSAEKFIRHRKRAKYDWLKS